MSGRPPLAIRLPTGGVGEVTSWQGKPLEDCTRDELLACIAHLGCEFFRLNTPTAIHDRALYLRRSINPGLLVQRRHLI